MTTEELIVIGFAFALGGLLKGATGFGAPLIAVPLMALRFDMAFAVTVFAIPNLIPNLWQAWQYRRDRPDMRFLVPFAIGGSLGMIPGTFLLVSADQRILSAILGGMILLYITFRFLNPSWRLSMKAARWLGLPVSVTGGLLQGSSGISAPVSLTFLNSIGLARGAFICTISVYFVSLGVLQLPLLLSYGELTWGRAMLGLAALLPLFAAMPVGARLARYLSKEAFDRLILVILALLAVKLLSSLI